MLLPLPHLRTRSSVSSARILIHHHIPPYRYPRSPFATPSRCFARPVQEPRVGTTTPVPDNAANVEPKSPFYFEAGYALYAKRPSRPFPPPFLSYPSVSFSEPLSTHHRSRDRRPYVNGEMIRGMTNGDDAVLVSDSFVAANDGVGAWAAREKGHAALWSRLIVHFWALEVERAKFGDGVEPDPVAYLQKAFEYTKEATSQPNEWFGTTTACAALLSSNSSTPTHPVLYITQLGDSQILVLRPRNKEVIFKTAEQWHWFDCPRQLGTNSPDTPTSNAVMDRIEIEEDDIVLAMTDGVIDNLWEHEVVQNVVDSMDKLKRGENKAEAGKEPAEQTYADGMRFVAQELLNAARVIAEDPFAESPYMEKAIDEGLSIEGGKLDDISVVAAQCKRRKV
ncbi:hypothetical protein K505DRAFT_231769 [Melanomma pulvis-pyrius CBS 109.77]|uniref:Protein phosphatase n=1 Tax=Melanomma pulvis-pyrius CBS 109.77 TaxID=1314802 RepID=A0A6A6XRP2_9PLEO|nr:hypothetical protein K505DRAFT_231769 [Melanomma pulvis-pyrius CBS 109.77]